MSTPSRQEVLHAYRHLYKGLLRGVSYSMPARFIVRDQIRLAFRNSTTTAADTATTTTAAAATTQWNPEAIKRTLWFLSGAAREKNLEHRILKNLVRMHSERAATTRHWRRASLWSKKPADERKRHDDAYEHYDATVAMLNKSMGLCLR